LPCFHVFYTCAGVYGFIITRRGFVVAPTTISSAMKRLPIGYKTNTFVQHARARIEIKEGTTRPFCGELLRNEKILIRPGDSFGDHTESNVRVPLIRPVDVLERVAEGIERQLKRG
jgi:hypothetical protein